MAINNNYDCSNAQTSALHSIHAHTHTEQVKCALLATQRKGKAAESGRSCEAGKRLQREPNMATMRNTSRTAKGYTAKRHAKRICFSSENASRVQREQQQKMATVRVTTSLCSCNLQQGETYIGSSVCRFINIFRA